VQENPQGQKSRDNVPFFGWRIEFILFNRFLSTSSLYVHYKHSIYGVLLVNDFEYIFFVPLY
jgi:hypothetical protein